MADTLAIYAALASKNIQADSLAGTLNSLALIDKKIAESTFLAGQGFFDNIVFLGCSPNMPLNPEQGEHFLKISIICTKQPVLNGTKKTPIPLCPKCSKPIRDTALPAQQNKLSGLCARCDSPFKYADLNFRKRGYFAQAAIHITPVFQSEAIPAEKLLETLFQEHKVDFKYAYI